MLGYMNRRAKLSVEAWPPFRPVRRLVLRVQWARDDLGRAGDDPVEVVGIALGHLHRLASAVGAPVVVVLIGEDAVVILDDLPCHDVQRLF